MYKILTGYVACLLLFFSSSCVEEDMNLRGTSSTIRLSFLHDGVFIKPDSVFAAGADSIHVYSDTLRTYILPLRSDQDSSEFTFYIDSLESDLTIRYSRTPTYDIDVIRHNAVFKYAYANSLDSIELVKNTDKLCSAVKASDRENIALTCGDSLNLRTNETTLRLYY